MGVGLIYEFFKGIIMSAILSLVEVVGSTTYSMLSALFLIPS